MLAYLIAALIALSSTAASLPPSWSASFGASIPEEMFSEMPWITISHGVIGDFEGAAGQLRIYENLIKPQKALAFEFGALA
jgi:hypothetical protein